MSGPVGKATEKEVCLVCGWPQENWETCNTVAEARRRDCARYTPSTTESAAGEEVSGIVFSGTPRSPSDFH